MSEKISVAQNGESTTMRSTSKQAAKTTKQAAKTVKKTTKQATKTARKTIRCDQFETCSCCGMFW